jgi:hypothetical protein
MIQLLIPALFWLSVPLSLIVSVIGVLKNSYWLALLGAVLFLPLSYYFNGSPTLHGSAILLPLFQVGSAAAVKENDKVWAWLLLLPAFFTVLWFVGVVVYYRIS